MNSQYPRSFAGHAEPEHNGHGPDGIYLPASDHYIIRLDGIILNNDIARKATAIWLRSIAGRYALVSSNSRDTARTMTAKLRRVGLDVPEHRIVLAGEEALRLAAARYPGARCKVLASRVLAHAARRLGLELVQDNAELILLGRDSAWTYRDLAQVVFDLARGAQLIASNDDMTCVGAGGRPIPDTGAILAAIEGAAGKSAAITRFSRAATLKIAQARLDAAGCPTLVISNQDADLDAVSSIAGLRYVQFQPPVYSKNSWAGVAHDSSGHCSNALAELL